MEGTQKAPVVAEIPSGVLLDIKDPYGNSVLVISNEELQLLNRESEALKSGEANLYLNQRYTNYCILDGNKVIASLEYPYKEIYPIVVEQFPYINKNKKEQSWM